MIRSLKKPLRNLNKLCNLHNLFKLRKLYFLGFKGVFIKKLFFILLIIVAGIYVSFYYFKPAFVEVGGINSRQVEVSLRKRPNISSKTITTLGVGEFSSLTKTANEWNYFYSVNHHLAIQKQDFKLGYSRVFGIFIFKTRQLEFYEKQIDAFVPLVIISLSIASFFYSFSRFRKKHQKNIPIHSSNEIEPLDSVYYIKPQLSCDNEQTESSRENEKKEYEKEVRNFFYREAKQEIEIITATYQNDMAEMTRTILSLKKKYNDAEKKASILGVSFNDKNIDNLVKGRLFELFAAIIWDKNYRTTIERVPCTFVRKYGLRKYLQYHLIFIKYVIPI